MSGASGSTSGSGGASGGSGTLGDGLLVVGDVVTDVVARHRTPLTAGTDTAADIRTLPGGAGANVASWAAYTGCPDVRLLARIGADSAAWHERALAEAGVRPHLVVDPRAPTGTVICLVDADAERTFLTDSGAVIRLSPADWSPTLLDGVGRVHLSGYLFFAEPSRSLARLVLDAAHARGVPVSVDPASAGFLADAGVAPFLAAATGADVLLPNRDEAAALTGLPDSADAVAKLSRQFPLVVAKLGAAGALISRAGAAPDHVPAVPARARDTTGAGDAFTGAFLAALLAGATDTEAVTRGCQAGAQAVTRVGARPPGPASTD
ncbi:carbohydrate kinase family protein [Streptomyces apocyni]|uniref:carbohydrate kinase family protein n=1 Tax=Streptomyces apocyni TaxID=2654677 RepID=UPI0012E9C056|nr:PfkB family carbohydrate kinase [Streptomyces apocyni]